MVLPAEFVQGTRRDGSPNLSHGWARTVDGAQGGTWESCHLLGNSALDAFRGYSGQSRSRQPTHTWNTATVTAVDHGGVLADGAPRPSRWSPPWPDSPTPGWPPAATRSSSTANWPPDPRPSGGARPSTTRPRPPPRGRQELARARDRQANLEAMAAGVPNASTSSDHSPG